MNQKFLQLWNEFNIKLKKFIISRVNDQDLANDILQDVFIKIHLNISKLEDSTKLTPWVYQIARNTITDYYRKQKPKSDIDEFDIQEPLLEKNFNEIFQKDMLKYINELPEKYRTALVLTEFKGMKQIELAQHLGISYSGAKTRVLRAKNKLKELFTDCCNIQSDVFGNIVDYNKKVICCTPSKCVN